MESFRKTRTAAGYAARHASTALTRVRAAALLEQLADWEAAADGNIRPQAAADPRLLRALVIAVRDLAGTGWLGTMADDPDVAAFTALSATASAPPLDRVDETCSRLLWARFSPLQASQAADEVRVRPAGAGWRPAFCPRGNHSGGGRTMSERDTVLRSMHDTGLAAWFGGSLMGAVGLNSAAAPGRGARRHPAASAARVWPFRPVRIPRTRGRGFPLSPRPSRDQRRP